jgi:hypothetical protein
MNSLDLIKSISDGSDRSGEEIAHNIPRFYRLTRIFNKISDKDSIIMFEDNQEHYWGKSRDSH